VFNAHQIAMQSDRRKSLIRWTDGARGSVRVRRPLPVEMVVVVPDNLAKERNLRLLVKTVIRVCSDLAARSGAGLVAPGS